MFCVLCDNSVVGVTVVVAVAVAFAHTLVCVFSCVVDASSRQCREPCKCLRNKEALTWRPVTEL